MQSRDKKPATPTKLIVLLAFVRGEEGELQRGQNTVDLRVSRKAHSPSSAPSQSSGIGRPLCPTRQITDETDRMGLVATLAAFAGYYQNSNRVILLLFLWHLFTRTWAGGDNV